MIPPDDALLQLCIKALEHPAFEGDASCFSVSTRLWGAPRLILATGENGTGKSLFLRTVAGLAVRNGVAVHANTPIDRPKTTDFAHASTGSRLAQDFFEVLAASRINERPHIVVLDHPDSALSPSYAAAMGELIGEHARSAPRACRGMLVVSHSVDLMRAVGIVAGSDGFQWIRFGDGFTFDDIIGGCGHTHDLTDLAKNGRSMFRAVRRAMGQTGDEG